MPGAAPLSSQRRQAPAGHHRPVPNQPVEDDASRQFAIISGFQLSAILTKPSAGNAAAATNPHRRSSVYRFPAGSFFRGFRTPALYRIDRSCSGRHPKPFRIPDLRREPLGRQACADAGRSAAGGLTGQVDPERPLWPRQWIFPSAVKRTFAPDFLYVLIIIGDSTNTSSSASASFRPAVSNPSVDQP